MTISPLTLPATLSRMPRPERVMGHVISSESHSKFAIDTASLWLPKMLFTVRSAAEALEVSFLEFVESGFFYYAPHNMAEKLFAPMYRSIASHLPEEVFKDKLLTKSVEEIRVLHPEKHAELLRHILPVKAAIILAAVGAAGVAGEYAVSFMKNLLTLKAFNKGRFTDIANLTDDRRDMRDPHKRAEIEAQNEAVKNKAIQRIKLAASVALGIVAVGAGLARFGHRLPGGAKLLERFVEKFDFDFKDGLFALSKKQFRAIVALGVVGYLDAARDNLELKETASRLAIVAPYLMIGNELLSKFLSKSTGKLFPELLQTAMKKSADGKDQLNYELSLHELLEDSVARARQTLEKTGGHVSEAAVQHKAKALMEPLVRGKNALFVASFLIGSIGVGLGTTLITQHFTKLRHQRQLAREAAQKSRFTAPPYARQPQTASINQLVRTPAGRTPTGFQPSRLPGFSGQAPSAFETAFQRD